MRNHHSVAVTFIGKVDPDDPSGQMNIFDNGALIATIELKSFGDFRSIEKAILASKSEGRKIGFDYCKLLLSEAYDKVSDKYNTV